MNAKRAAALLEAGLSSVNSDFCADPATYEALRAGASWTRTRDGLLHLVETAERLNRPFRLVVKDLAAPGKPPDEARACLEATRDIFRSHPSRVVVIPVQFHNALGQSLEDLSVRSGNGQPGRYNLCHMPWVLMTVDWAGRVVACCRDLRSEYVLGNILEEDPWRIWNGDRARALRRALAARKPEAINVCSNCDLPWRGSYSGRTPLDRLGSFLFSRVYNTR
jgi:radical SAM protein with 4Fe4S-binding SPASM domain